MSSEQPHTRSPAYHLRVENFGKLAEADVRIGDFTVLAGPNNTSKSFVSKLLYSIFSALDTDLPRERVANLVSSFAARVRQVTYHYEGPTTETLQRIVDEMTQAATSYSDGEIERLDDVVTRLSQAVSEITDVIAGTTCETGEVGASYMRQPLQRMTSALKEAANPRAFSLVELQHQTKRALTRNFQVSDMRSIAGDPDRDIVVNVAGLLQFRARRDEVDWTADDAVPALPPGHRNVVYIESPVYWKLFDALQDAKRYRRRPRFDRERLNDVPDYFYDLAETIKHKYTGEMAFPDVHRQLVGEDGINGKVRVSDTGDIVFEEAGRSFPLVTAAAGVANVGFLAMLIERKVIDRGTMLFIDETRLQCQIDSLTAQLRGDLRGALTSKVVDQVEILPVEELREKLPATPAVT